MLAHRPRLAERDQAGYNLTRASPVAGSGRRARGQLAVEQSTYREFAARYARLESSDWRAALWTLRVAATTAVAFWLSAQAEPLVWLGGQALLAVAILQWFFLLHDCGHRHFFKTPWLNTLVGHLASIFCIVPFTPWRSIHAQHHLWTGWKDRDPTQASVTLAELPRPLRVLMDVCWVLWIPLFTSVFGIRNFWNLPRCLKHFTRSREEGLHHAFSLALIVAAWVLAWVVAFPQGFWQLYALGFLGFFVLSDPLLLSQHSHMPSRTTEQEEAVANKLWDQDQFTRSVVFPRWVSRYLLLNFDVHIAHHLLPNIPCYHLGAVHDELETVNTIDWWTWLRAAKRTPAHVLLLQSRLETGYDF